MVNATLLDSTEPISMEALQSLFQANDFLAPYKILKQYATKSHNKGRFGQKQKTEKSLWL